MMNAKAFLFPSIFEGFGMPPVEALQMGTTVITTNCASLPEVTRGKAIYVENPFDEREWVRKMIDSKDAVYEPLIFEEYKTEHVARQYLTIFKDFCKL